MAGIRRPFLHHSQQQRKKCFGTIVRLLVLAMGAGYFFFMSSYGNPKVQEPKGQSALNVQEVAVAAPKKTIAYAISVTADGPYMDGAAVLAHAIRKASATSKYGFDLVAFVLPTVTTSRKPLEKAGWKILEKDLPLQVDEIEGEYLRDKIKKNGCCGASELLKLYSWQLTEYHRVVHLDMDSLVLQQMDEIYDMDYNFLYTCDYGMMTKGSKACPVQGGFLVIRPTIEEFNALVGVMRKGDYRGDGSAWGGTNIGWFWGGMTIQGLLPYYYMTLADPKVSLEVDRCMYNNMFDNPECRNTSVPLVKNVHFTVCQKPWSCHKHDKNVRCNIFLDKWYELREELELEHTGKSVKSCQRGRYTPLAYLAEPPKEQSATE